MPAYSSKTPLWKRCVLYAGCIAAGVFAFYFQSQWRTPTSQQTMATDAYAVFDDLDFDINLPTPEWDARTVVTRQIDSLRNWRSQPLGMVECFSLASPENRKLTGPLRRFTQIATSPPYTELVTADAWQVGQPTGDEFQAQVLVSTSSPDGGVAAFRFELTRQSAGPNQDCWLTDTVMVIPQIHVGNVSPSLRGTTH